VLHLYDTAARAVVPIAESESGQVGMYVCGPTVYGPPHVGHGRSTLVFDVLRRYLEWRGAKVVHVSNVTDIDDKIIQRAQDEGRPWQDIAQECEAEWWAAMAEIGAERPVAVPHATEYLDGMIELISELVGSDKAYETSDGVYLSVDTVPNYGTLSGQSLDQLQSGARVEVSEEKRSPLDFALWKLVKPGEPYWSSPFGDGRPGWHTECVVMSLSLLGEGFALHGGGQDLIFPHHENERAQATAIGRTFAQHWVHHGFVTVRGEKMAKSTGNYRNLADLVAASDSRAYRLLVLRSHYRQPLEVTRDLLDDASAALARLDGLGRRFADVPDDLVPTDRSVALSGRVIAAMDDDLDTPTAVAALFEAVREANGLADQGDLAGAGVLAQSVVELFGALGLVIRGASEVPNAIVERMRARDAARADRDFAGADAIRAELESLGYRVEDTPDGTRVHRDDHGR
jgi:cysteinyl-tRNA synthetase